MKMITKPYTTLFSADTLVSIAMFDENEPTQDRNAEATMLELAFIRQ
ncbi:MAG: hypothetical protein ACPGMQ_09890 [Pirellulales bacterium]|jgi:hypothetical protein